jgi:ATP-dependent helicase/nuclease subunit B
MELVKSFEDALRALGFSAGDYGEELEGRLRGLALTDCLGTNRLGPGRGKEALMYMINSFLPSDEAPGIRITSLTAAAGLSSHGSLYIGGLKDGDIPTRPEMDYLLPERLRSRLGLRTMRQHLLKEEFEFRRLVLSPGRKKTKTIRLSYPEMESDKLFLPSVFLSEGEKRSPDRVCGIFSKEEEMTRPSGVTVPYSGLLPEIKAASRKDRKRMYITDIDAFRRCPRKFFIEKEMGLAPPEAEEMPPDARTVGTVIHKVMEGAVPAVKDGFDQFRQKASRALEEALRENEVEPYWARLLKETFLEQARGLYDLELEFSSGGFRFGRAEARVEGVLAGLHLYGKADRIDIGPEGTLRIIDYKTGDADLRPQEVLKKGAALQLFLYAALLGGSPAGNKIDSVGLYSLKDLKAKFVPGKRDSKNGTLIGDYISSALEYLEETADRIRAGDFSARPLEESACRNCHEKPYCPRNNGHGKQ